MKLIRFILSFMRRLRNAEHYDFYNNIANQLKSITFKPASIVPLVENFLQSFQREDTIYKRYLRQQDTIQVKDAHDKRRKSITALKLVVETGLYSNVPQVAEAAKALKAITDNYAEAVRAPMTEVSAMVANMIQDLLLPKYANAVSTVSLTDAIDRLKQDNDDFMTVYYERASSWEDEKDEGRLADARNQTDVDFGKLVDVINILFQANELQNPKDAEVSTILGGVIHTISTYIHQYETIYSRRSPRFHAGKDQPGLPDNGGNGEGGNTTPNFIISAQTILGSVSGSSNIGDQMSLLAADPAAFADILYPEARNGVMKIFNPETDLYENFPVAEFLYDSDGTTPVGLIVGPPSAKVTFDKPFTGFGDIQTVEIIKEGELLATLSNVQYPYTIIDN
ncbi:MAG: DUF6261 family protein [Tannerellaceae bacterium]|jgi:hypothetical protein|nr:DUF6261 family protein [Tannerellaceae bacterium]